MTRTRGSRGGGAVAAFRRAPAVVGDSHLDRVRAVPDAHVDLRDIGASVTPHVGQRLLHDPEHREIDALGDPRGPWFAVDGEGHRQPRGQGVRHEALQLRDPRLGRVRARLAVAQHAEHPTHVRQRGAPGVADAFHGRLRLLGRSVHRAGCAVGHHHDDAQAVRDDVVDLPRDPCALRRRRDRCLGGLLAFELLGPLAQAADVVPARLHQPAPGPRPNDDGDQDAHVTDAEIIAGHRGHHRDEQPADQHKGCTRRDEPAGAYGQGVDRQQQHHVRDEQLHDEQDLQEGDQLDGREDCQRVPPAHQVRRAQSRGQQEAGARPKVIGHRAELDRQVVGEDCEHDDQVHDPGMLLEPVRPTAQLRPRGPDRLAAVLARGEYIHRHRRYRSRSINGVSRPPSTWPPGWRHSHALFSSGERLSHRVRALLSAVDRSRHPMEHTARWCHARLTIGVGGDRQNQGRETSPAIPSRAAEVPADRGRVRRPGGRGGLCRRCGGR